MTTIFTSLPTTRARLPEAGRPRLRINILLYKIITAALFEHHSWKVVDHRMILEDIYKWIAENTDKAADPDFTGQQNSARHNLSIDQASRGLLSSLCLCTILLLSSNRNSEKIGPVRRKRPARRRRITGQSSSRTKHHGRLSHNFHVQARPMGAFAQAVTNRVGFDGVSCLRLQTTIASRANSVESLASAERHSTTSRVVHMRSRPSKIRSDTRARRHLTIRVLHAYSTEGN